MTEPTPLRFIEAVNGFQRTAVIRTAMELDIFTVVGEGVETAEALAARLGIAEKGARVLADALVVLHLLTKSEGRYGLTAESALFLDRKSARFLGDSVKFQLSEAITGAYARFSEAVKKGGTASDGAGALEPEHPMWLEFAKGMAPLMYTTVLKVAEVAAPAGRVLEVAAGHGKYGIGLLESGAAREVTALDWPGVLKLAEANAKEAGVAEQWRGLAGDALTTEWGTGYDTVLLANFLHHFDVAACRGILEKARAALTAEGRVVLVEHVPEEDRVSPSAPAWFAVQMLATTPAGDAYTLAEYTAMLLEAGFTEPTMHKVPGAARHVLVAERRVR